MNKLAAFLAINSAFVGANVVAAGVYRVLGEVVHESIPDADLTVWPWILVGIAAAGAAFVFLVGLLASSKNLLKRLG